MNFSHSHVVVGLGVTGMSVVRYLVQQGIEPMVCDTRLTPPCLDEFTAEFPHISIQLGALKAEYFAQAQQIIVSPGISLQESCFLEAKQNQVEIIGDIELFARAVRETPAKVIGITGSNGKSTVTTLVYQMLKASGLHVEMGGNIGIPALSLLARQADVYVLELSSFQLETTSSLACDVATVLNVSEDHLDRYTNFNDYVQAKLRIFIDAKQQLLPSDDCFLSNKVEETTALTYFGENRLGNNAWYIKQNALWFNDICLIAIDKIRLMGKHNYLNLLAAMALSNEVGVMQEAMVTVAKNFSGLPHRFQYLTKKQGVSYVNDSKATNVGATISAMLGLEDFAGKICLIAGGDSKEADLSELKPALERAHHVVTLGKDARKITEFVSRDKCTIVDSMSEAVNIARNQMSDGDMVLLSPACASLDMYRNFEDRGDDFRRCVEALS